MVEKGQVPRIDWKSIPAGRFPSINTLYHPRSHSPPYSLPLFLFLSFDSWIEPPPCVSHVETFFFRGWISIKRDESGRDVATRAWGRGGGEGAEKSATTLTERQEWKDKGEINSRIVTIGRVLARTSGTGAREVKKERKKERKKGKKKGRKKGQRNEERTSMEKERERERERVDERGSRIEKDRLSESVDGRGEKYNGGWGEEGDIPSMDIE